MTLLQGDCRDLLPTLPPGSVDAIVTDPPYPEEYIPLYGQLAEYAAHVLKPGGVLAAMCGQSYLPEILAIMGPHLTYRWTIAYVTLGGEAVQVWPRRILAFWKPVLVFSNGAHNQHWFGDVARSAGNDKRYHQWGQSVSGMVDLIKRLSVEGDTVLDPFMGGGTTAEACALTGRAFIGIEQDGTTYAVACQRIARAQAAYQPLLLEVGT